MFLSLLPRDAIDDGTPNPRGEKLANLSIAFACLSFTFVTSRLSSRFYIRRRLGIDDYLIFIAMLLAICMAVSFNEEAKNGFGLHKTQVSKAHLIKALKWFFVAQILYKVAICITKLSILFYYLRIFPSRGFKIASYAIGGVVIAYTIGGLCATIWSCHPIERSWNKALPGKCIQIGDVWYSTSVMAIVTDLAIIILPIYEIRRLQLPILQKLALCVMFSLGFFVVACTVVRMAVVGPAVTAVDTPYFQATSNSWTFLEVNVAIICACLPDLKGAINLLPCFGRNKTVSSSSQYADFERGNYSAKSVLPSYNARVTKDNESDEQFILHDLSSVKKTTDINITFDKTTPEDGPRKQQKEFGR